MHARGLVFSDYNLHFWEADGKALSKGGDGSADADDKGKGDDIGSEDSEEDPELSNTSSMKSFIHDEQDDEMYKEEGTSGKEQDIEQDDVMHGEPDTAMGNEQDGKAQFAAAYDVDMGAIDLE
ncbi:hypothetical protein C8R44DRAFT_871761 [Mycena epipterygia]|nr:hypothetical protein C8R44DRAFT_871761 [Mycena epipterygia]